MTSVFMSARGTPEIARSFHEQNVTGLPTPLDKSEAHAHTTHTDATGELTF